MKEIRRLIRRNIVFLGTVLVLFLHCIVTVNAEEPVNFILVMDETRSLNDNDPNGYCQSALDMFLNMLPVEDVNVGIIGFGRKQSEGFPLSHLGAYGNAKHQFYIREACPVVAAGTPEGMEQLVNAMNGMVWDGNNTIIDGALRAAVDELFNQGTVEGRGCVILLTDGDYTRAFTGQDNELSYNQSREVIFNSGHAATNAETVAAANSSAWPIYCIELDYAIDAGRKAGAHQYLTGEITDLSIDGETHQITDAAQIHKAFFGIIDRFYHAEVSKTVETNDQGYAHYDFDLPDLTSEANITIGSDTIKGVRLRRKGSEEPAVIVGDFDNIGTEANAWDETIYKVRRGKIFCNIKMVLPDAGGWELDVLAAPNTSVEVNNISFSDLNAKLSLNEKGAEDEEPLGKDDFIEGKLTFVYDGKTIGRKSLGSTEATLVVENQLTGEQIKEKMEWDDAASCFTGSIHVRETGLAGELKVWAVVDYAGGESFSTKAKKRTSYNAPVEIIEGAEITAEEYVRKNVEPISIEGIFTNPDNDILYTKLDETENGSDEEKSAATISYDENSSVINIFTGDIVTEYNHKLLIWDVDMGEDGAVEIPIHLNVLNHPIETKAIDDYHMDAELKKATGNLVQLWKLFKNGGGESRDMQIDLYDYFSDEDQEILEFEVTLDEKGEKLLEKTLEEFTDDEGKQHAILKLVGTDNGTAGVTVAAKDDDEQMVPVEFKVYAATAMGIRGAALKGLIIAGGIYSVIIITVTLLIIAWLIIMASNRQIRGTWIFKIFYVGETSEIPIDVKVAIPKKDRHKNSVWKMISKRIDNTEPAQAALRSVQNILTNIEITGVTPNYSGGKIQNKNKNKNMHVFVNRNEINNKKTRFSGGTAELVIPCGVDDIRITITLRK